MDNLGKGFNVETPIEGDSHFQLGHSIAFWLGRASHILQESFNRNVVQHDITWPQWMVLNVLFHQSAETPAQVADHLGVDRSAVTRLADRLCKKNLLERKQDGIDRRCVKLVLTPKGSRLIQVVNHEAAQHQQKILAQLPQESADGLDAGLRQLLNVLGVDGGSLR